MASGSSLAGSWRMMMAKAARLKPVTASQTLVLGSRGVFRVNVTATCTVTLPSVDQGRLGFIECDDTSTVTIADASGTISTFTGSTGRNVAMVYASAANRWSAIVFGSGSEASNTGIDDAGGFTSEVSVENALQELYKARIVDVPVTSFVVNNGAQLTTWADNAASNPGFTLLTSGPLAIRWNDNNNSTGIMTQVLLPPRSVTGDTGAATLNLLVSKSGNTSGAGENTSFAASIIPFQNNTLFDASASIGGNTTAVNGQRAAKTISTLTLDFGLAGMSQLVTGVSIQLTPNQSTVNTDDLVLHGCWISFDEGTA